MTSLLSNPLCCHENFGTDRQKPSLRRLSITYGLINKCLRCRPLEYRNSKLTVHCDKSLIIMPLALCIGYHSRLPSSKSILSYRLLAFDVATGFIAPILALCLRDPALFGSGDSEGIAIYVSVGGSVSILFFILFRLAHGLPRYFSFHDAIEIAKGSACAVAGTTVLSFTFTRLEAIPRSTLAIHFLVLVAALIAGRLVRRITIQRREIGSVFDIRHNDERNLIILGAGHLAWFYIRLLDSFAIDNRRVVAILDDDESLRGRSMFGHVILGGTAEAATILDDFAQHGIEISGFVICEHDKERAVELSYRLESLCRDRGLQLEILADKLGVLKGTSEDEVRDCHPFRRYSQTSGGNMRWPADDASSRPHASFRAEYGCHNS